MVVNKAVDSFHGDDRLNCAQAVLKGFQQIAEIPDSFIEEFHRMGGGRAQDGVCGAFFAAIELANCEESAQKLRDIFIAAAASDKCREIRAAKTLSCRQCVELAARELLELVESGEAVIATSKRK